MCGINFIFIIMQLKEQFTNIIFVVININSNSNEPIKKCTKIAENFTIGFVQWCLKEENNIYFETEQLLEIYKKTL